MCKMMYIGLTCALTSLLVDSFQATVLDPDCGGKPADVYFALDSSGSLSRDDFEKELRFTQDVASVFDLDDDKVRVGLVTFSKTVTPHFGLGDYNDRRDLFRKISDITWEGYGTNTGEALNYLHTKGFNEKNTRQGIPHIAIILTDGMSQNASSTVENAKLMHEKGITVFVIGIGKQIDKMELETIASKPSGRYVFMIDNFNALTTIIENLAGKACEEKPATPAPNIQNTEAEVEDELVSFGRCTPRNPLDIVFAVDTAAIGASNSKFVLQFIGNISDRLNMVLGDSTIMTVGNGCSGSKLDETPATDPNKVKEGLSMYETPKYDELMKNMRLKAAEGRFKTRHIGIMFATDRLSPYEYSQAERQMWRANFQKITIFAIGVGHRIDADEYRALTINGGHYMWVPSFEELGEIGNALLYDLCIFGKEE